MRGLFREFAIARKQHEDRLEELTFAAFQTVRVWALTKSKKGRMPRFESLLPKRASDGRQTVEQMKAAVEQLSMYYGKRLKFPMKAKADGQ